MVTLTNVSLVVAKTPSWEETTEMAPNANTAVLIMVGTCAGGPSIALTVVKDESEHMHEYEYEEHTTQA
jgi:hypothetical protein